MVVIAVVFSFGIRLYNGFRIAVNFDAYDYCKQCFDDDVLGEPGAKRELVTSGCSSYLPCLPTAFSVRSTSVGHRFGQECMADWSCFLQLIISAAMQFLTLAPPNRGHFGAAALD